MFWKKKKIDEEIFDYWEPIGKINIELNIDGAEPVDKGKEYLNNAPLLLANPMFGQEVKEYIAEQFMALGIECEGDMALLIRGKIYGASELYARIKGYELEAEEGKVTTMAQSYTNGSYE